ncbi:D-alanyl-D-alanine carboxypeptidase DacA [Candidatus Hartigia pinicola]|nr:D-alanyl-D-alanine carboxypeptidase DacA [Candidatus Hartigia pinicola]
MNNFFPLYNNRYISFGIVLLFTLVNIVHANESFPNIFLSSSPEIDTEAYILLDYHSGKVLLEKNADQRYDPASLTKIMTSYVIGQAIKSGNITSKDIVTVNEDAWATGNPVFKGSSLMFLKPGDRVLVSQLTRGINLQSGNDACVAMADYIAGDQVNFVRLMNDYVNKLGLKNTHFKNVHGLDAYGQYSSARDMALIAQSMIRDIPDEYAIYKEKEFTFNNIRQFNRNKLLWDKSLSVDGIKTGYTVSSGFNLVTSATENKMRLISVVLGAKNIKVRDSETKKLLTYGFRYYETVKPLKAGVEFISCPVWFADKKHVKLGVTEDLVLSIPRGRLKDLKASYNILTKELKAPLIKGQKVGIIDLQFDNQTLQLPLVVLKDIEEGSCFSRVIDYIKLLFYRWWR